MEPEMRIVLDDIFAVLVLPGRLLWWVAENI